MPRRFRESCSKVPEFRILGELPNGDPQAQRALTHPVLQADRTGILRDCWALANSAVAISLLPRAADMEDEQLTGTVDARAFVSAIDRYRYAEPTATGKDLRDQRISPLDVLLHVCRLIDRLIAESGFAPLVLGANKPSNEFMKHRAAELRSTIDAIAQQSRVDLSVPGPATAAHKAAMEAYLALDDD